MGTLNSDKLLARKKKGKGFPLGGVEGKGLLLRTVRERAHQRARNRVRERERNRALWVCRARKSFPLLSSRTTRGSSKGPKRKQLYAVETQTGPQAAVQKIPGGPSELLDW